MKKWYDLVNLETQEPIIGEDCSRLFTGYEVARANAMLTKFRWICIDSIFIR